VVADGKNEVLVSYHIERIDIQKIKGNERS